MTRRVRSTHSRGLLAALFVLGSLAGCTESESELGSEFEPEFESELEGGRQPGEPGPGRPNIILLVVDTLRTDHIHGYGYPRETTPTLDAIMQGGVRFDAAIAPSSWSAPSHTTIVTGVQPWRHRVMGWSQRIAPGVRPLAARLTISRLAEIPKIPTPKMGSNPGLAHPTLL